MERHSQVGLKVLLVGPYPMEDGKVIGGVESVVSTLAPALAAQEDIAQVTVLHFRRGLTDPHRRAIGDKLQVWHLPAQNLAVLTRTMWDVRTARQIVKELQPDVVHGQGADRHGYIATRIGAASVVTIHGLWYVEARMTAQGRPQGLLRAWLIENMVGAVLRRARVVISISGYDLSMLRAMIRGRTVSICNPVPDIYFANSSPPAASARILYGGLVIPRKNLEGLFRAFATVQKAVPAAHLVVAGPTPDPTYLRVVTELARSLGVEDKITFTGLLSSAQLIEEMRACCAVVLFSHQETSPTILGQALAMGRPVVSSRVGGVDEMIIDGETGYVIEPGDELALAERLVTLLHSPELCTSMGERGHAFARSRYEPSVVARQTVVAYRLAMDLVAGNKT
jgi:glycosyltransferase involved in cell wall biosynthesis